MTGEHPEFRTSSRCSIDTCVAVAPLSGGGAAVRDTKARPEDAATLVFDAAEWSDFVAGVKDGEFDFA